MITKGDTFTIDGREHRVCSVAGEYFSAGPVPPPPTPDYYINCPGAEPRDGDLFVSEPQGLVVLVTGDKYRWLYPGGTECPLRAGGWQHSLDRRGCVDTRTLIVRDGLPYTQTYEIPF